VVLAETPEALLAFRSAAPEGCALFALYAGPTPVAAELYGVALAAGTEALFVPVGGADPDAANDAGSPLRAALATALADASWPKRVHDARDTYTVLAQHGLPLTGVVLDTQLASYLIDPTAHLPHELEQVARAFLQRVLPSLAAPEGAPAKRARPTLSDTDPGARAVFACSRALAIEELRAPLEALLTEQDQARVMRDLELPLARVLADMQCAGVRVDAAALSALSTEFEQRKAAIEAEIFELAGRPFNLASTKQLGEVLFDELKLPVQKRTKTGYSTDAEVLERLAPKHPIAEKILRQRELAKLINTYTRGAARRPSTRARGACTAPSSRRPARRGGSSPPSRTCSARPFAARTASASARPSCPRGLGDGVGRLEPDRAAPAGPPVSPTRAHGGLPRRGGRAPPHGLGDLPLHPRGGHARPAQRGQDRELRHHLRPGRHRARPGAGGHAQRGQGLHRALLRGLRRRAHLAGPEHRGRAPNTATWTPWWAAGARSPSCTSGDPATRAYGERIAANTPIQGSAADLCKLAMLGIARRVREEGLAAAMVLQIHDELLFEVPEAEVDAVVALVRHHMSTAYALAVPLVVDVGVGRSWAEAKS
jgi:DNA polymerase-1